MTHLRHALAACVMLVVMFVAWAPACADWKESRQLAEQACMMCHSAEMLAQQRLMRAQWDKTLAKMAKWGPEMQEGEPEELAAYFAGPQSPAAAPLTRATLTKAELAARLAPGKDADRGNAEAGAAAFAKDCAVCHGKEARGLLGPALIGRPVVSRPSEWTAVIRKGRRRMPAYDDRLSSTQIQDMLAWVRKISREMVEPRIAP